MITELIAGLFKFQWYTEGIKTLSGSALVDLYTNRAHALLKLERYAEAKSDAQKATELNPTEFKAHYRKGVSCFHLQQYEEALEAFQECQKNGAGTCFIS